MSRVLVLKCEHVAEVMEISDLIASSSASVKGVGAVSQPFFSLPHFQLCLPYCTIQHATWRSQSFLATNVNFRERDPRTMVE